MLNIYCICKVSVCLLPSWILSCKTKTTFDIICLRVKLVSCLCTFPDSCSSQRAGLSLRTAVPCGLLIPAVWCRPCSSCSSWRRSTESSELSESPASIILGQIQKRKVDETLLLRFLLTHEETSELPTAYSKSIIYYDAPSLWFYNKIMHWFNIHTTHKKAWVNETFWQIRDVLGWWRLNLVTQWLKKDNLKNKIVV